jgi:hypothetical protein
MVLPPDRIAEMAERIRAYTGAVAPAPNGGSAEEPEDGEEAG